MRIGLIPESMGEHAMLAIADGCQDVNAEFVLFPSCAEALRVIDREGSDYLDHLITGIKVNWRHFDSQHTEIDATDEISEAYSPPWFFPLMQELSKKSKTVKIHVLSFTAELFSKELTDIDCSVTPITPSIGLEELRKLPARLLS